MNIENLSSARVLRLKHVVERVGLSRSTIYDKLDADSPRYDESFPKKIRLSISAVGWIESEIDGWIEGRTRLNNNEKG